MVVQQMQLLPWISSSNSCFFFSFQPDPIHCVARSQTFSDEVISFKR